MGGYLGIARDVTLGGEILFTYGNSSEKTLGLVGVNCNYHFHNLLDLTPKLDLFAGPTAGFSVKNTDDYIAINLGAQAGAIYALIPDLLYISTEISAGSSSGASFKLIVSVINGKAR